MSDSTPDRLKEFRASRAPQSRGTIAWTIANLFITVIGVGVIVVLLLREPPIGTSTATAGGLSPEKQREYAVYLAEKQQPVAAVTAYERYLDTASLTSQERAKICYSVGKLAADSERYEEALAYLYQSEFLDPNSDLKDDIGKKIIYCLEKLGRNVDLRHELRKRTDVKRTAADVKDGEVVLADIAGEVITDRDLELEIEKLPQAARDSFATPEKKTELLKNLVAERLLRDKARRQELDKDPEVQEQLGKALDTMIVQKLISNDVRSSVSITPEDVERYYKAEIDRFKQPATAQVIVAKAENEDAAKAVTEFTEKAVMVRQGGHVPGTPESVNASDVIFAAEANTVAGPVKGDDGWYVFKVISKTPEKTPEFEEVKDQAERMLRMQKEQERFRALIEETLQAQNVHLYLDRLKGSDSKP